jgi:hypothetical protein
MAAHEESERIAVEGELAQLEADWREAEEIASISDNMFLPQSITDFIKRHRPRCATFRRLDPGRELTLCLSAGRRYEPRDNHPAFRMSARRSDAPGGEIKR